MATVLDLVKHYQHAIEKYPNDEQKVLKCIDKLFNLDVTVQHLQDTGVGRTVNALRKEPGDVGHAARALVYKWKLMVAAEESDHDGDHNNDTSGYNGHENGKDSDENAKNNSTSRHKHQENSGSNIKTESKEVNGDYSGSKRKYQSSEEEEPDIKKSKGSSYNSHDNHRMRPVEQIKREPSQSDSEDSDNSQTDDSESEMSESSQEEKHTKPQIKQELTDKHKSSSSSNKHSSNNTNHTHTHKSSNDSKRDSSSSKRSHESENNSKKQRPEAIDKHSSEKSSAKEKSHSSSHKHKSSKDKNEKSSKSDKHLSEKDKKQKEEFKSSSSSSKHKSDSDKNKHSKTEISVEKHHTEKHSSKSEKHKSSSHSHKSDKEKHKSSSEKEVSDDKHKSKHSSSSSSIEKHSSSSKERSKQRSSSSKEKSDNSIKDSHRSEKKHSSSDSKSKHSNSKHKADRRDEGSSESKSKHKSSSSSSHKSKSSSSKSMDEVPKKNHANNSSVDSDDGIDCGSGASFAEALGMISPAKPKKKSAPLKETPTNNDLSPASLLSPSAKLAPLPAIEISALPEISPNYKPRPPPKLLPHFTDEDAMSMTMSSKNQRTKVYSGNKVIGKIPTLYEMCVQVLQEHIDALEYTGGVPYDILKPVVDRATPQQMFVLEHYNPYLMEDTDHLWQKFCERNFRNKQRQEMETWREMYMRCQEEQEHRLKSLTANIRMTQEAKKAPIKQTKMAYVDSVVKPPRNIARKQALHGTAHAASASPAARVASLAAAPNVLRGSARPAPAAASAPAFKPKKAPLMQKALQFMRGRKR